MHVKSCSLLEVYIELPIKIVYKISLKEALKKLLSISAHGSTFFLAPQQSIWDYLRSLRVSELAKRVAW